VGGDFDVVGQALKGDFVGLPGMTFFFDCDTVPKKEKIDGLAKSPAFVTPVKTGVQNILKVLDTGFRRYDGKVDFPTFCEFINNELI
jgi:hypothetical protein